MSGNIFARLYNRNRVMTRDPADNEPAAHRLPRPVSPPAITAKDTGDEHLDDDQLSLDGDAVDLSNDVLLLDVPD
jgi:hypothetical protein